MRVILRFMTKIFKHGCRFRRPNYKHENLNQNILTVNKIRDGNNEVLLIFDGISSMADRYINRLYGVCVPKDKRKLI